jgi:hypothetical protein
VIEAGPGRRVALRATSAIFEWPEPDGIDRLFLAIVRAQEMNREQRVE